MLCKGLRGFYGIYIDPVPGASATSGRSFADTAFITPLRVLPSGQFINKVLLSGDLST